MSNIITFAIPTSQNTTDEGELLSIAVIVYLILIIRVPTDFPSKNYRIVGRFRKKL